MSQQRHASHLKQYLGGHKKTGRANEGNANDKLQNNQLGQSSQMKKDNAKVSGDVRPKTKVPSKQPVSSKPTANTTSQGARKPLRRPSYHGYMTARLAYTIQVSGKLTLDNFPDEMMLTIFSFLSPSDLLQCTRVCKRWKSLTSDNVLWQKIYKRHTASKPSTKGGKKPPKNAGPEYWKSECIARCSNSRSSKVLPLMKKIDRFTGLPANTEKALQTAGIRWLLSLVDMNGEEFVSSHSDVFHFRMSVHVRWYSLTTTPLYRVKKIRIYAGNPVFFDQKGKAVPNSPCQRSLLQEVDFRWSDCQTNNPPIGSDDAVDVYRLPGGLLLAVWKNGGELAFISGTFHARHLVDRCMKGTPKQCFFPAPHKPLRCDIDSRYGLHSYTCTLELRNQRNSLWTQQFTNCDCAPEGLGGVRYGKFTLIDPDKSYQRSSVSRGKKITLPWKTEAFKGIVPNLCILDLTLLDEQGKPMWCSSWPVKLAQPKVSDVTYEYDGDTYHVEGADDLGKVKMTLIWEAAEKQYMMTGLDLYLSLSFINRWFATGY